LVACAASAAVMLGAALAAPAASAQGVGASTGPDPIFPGSGNGGYDVAHYDIQLDYTPRHARLEATTTISATATQSLSSFFLDFRGPRVTSAAVDGQPVTPVRQHGEMRITPPAPIAQGQDFVVAVAYAGKPHPVKPPDGSLSGWIATGDGAFVANEPTGAPSWFPCNDHPIDKATFDFRVTVPRGRKAFANGVLVDRIRQGSKTTFVWHEDEPMATYLATATNGRFRLEQSSVAGVPSYVAVDPREARDSRAALRKLPAISAYFASVFGPYPFSATGAVVDRAPFVGYALETQTKPVFDRAPNDVLLAHELAHQWFGDSVSLARWSDIWLNEGFATWAQWLWHARRGGDSLERAFEGAYSVPAKRHGFWNPPPGNPGGAKHLFDSTIYVRGAMALEALRQKLGDLAFFTVLQRWVAEHRYGNATIPDFIALAESVSGQNLGDFFRIWLFEPGKPTGW
jgi:aminopeptidase N